MKQFKERNVIVIIGQVLDLIPETEVVLLNKIDKFNSKLIFKAPEILTHEDCWKPFLDILNKYIPNITEEWQIEIRDLVNGTK